MSYGTGFLNSNIIPRSRTAPSQTFATGKHAIAICDRCGWKYKWTRLSTEPGTLLKVCATCNDGRYSLVCHPQNFVSTNTIDAIALRWARPDLAPYPNGLDSTPPWIIATENGDLIEWSQEIVQQVAVTAGQITWQSPPFGYD